MSDGGREWKESWSREVVVGSEEGKERKAGREEGLALQPRAGGLGKFPRVTQCTCREDGLSCGGGGACMQTALPCN